MSANLLKNMIRKLVIVVIVVIVFLLLFTIMINIPGDIEPQLTKGESLPAIAESSSLVKIQFIDTAHFQTPEAFTMAGGSLFKNMEMIHGAILVTHREDTFLFDTGLGDKIDEQYEQDMPAMITPFMSYEKGESVIVQLNKNSDLPKPNRIILSHSHWDHASGIVDFPELDVWVPSSEYQFLKNAEPPAVFPSQVSSNSIKWREYSLSADDYAGFENSLDVYDDGSVVLVSLSGHSPGSIGMFVNTSDGQRYLFVGDAVWNLDAIKNLKSKFWISSMLADLNQEETSLIIAKLHALLKANPELKIVPAHDLRAWKI